MKILFNLLLLIVIAIILVIKPKKEGFDEIDNGICDCCDCGLISCKECESKRQECCGNSMGFDRYTFKKI